MSWAGTLSGEVGFEVGYRLHRLGLTGGGAEVTPGYARAEAELRRVARVKMPPAVPWRSVREALAAEEVPEGAQSDRPWYEKRVAAGEGREASELASALVAIDTRYRPAREVALVISPALRPLPFGARAPHPGACGERPIVALGPRTPASLALLGAAALDVEAAVLAALPDELGAETRHFVVCMVAGSLLVADGVAPAALDALLVDATRALIPPQHRDGVLAARIGALVRHDLIDQPPGEIERITHGLARRRADRLLRAWQRGFFVPGGLSIEGLRAGTR